MKCLLTIIILMAITSTIKAETFKVTDQVYFDIMIDNHPVGRIVIGLFGDIAPKTVKNFITLATTGIDGKKYAGTNFHRVAKRFMIQGGDVENRDGTGSISIYGKFFDDETFEIKHGPLIISMANRGKNTNGCQFFITTIPTPWLDDDYTAFGKVISGEAVVFKIEQTKTDKDEFPLVPIIIYDSGILPTKPFTVSDNPHE
ncbi:PREDICTED: peptidyl-prolyl cis-trans isomerase, rhodopsin-specific isozyme-like [Cyphomyrmex costatus]|uniref:peptidyl-prolyl cis-trans isomerase, rhodopsin-specific isozyme-like n=1 Tax=Cyphomyrmex costatus TaxID=456900 RepID=UPI0008522728|nr:PREDICTED: peptidyl-prolyl cis-trans isomerase, rhodopsin-specific isozyme-like [Cyphomyrmex costatus]